ncbi:MAG: hypothetical protein ACR2L3_00140 [Actinomycetota bacterium]
MSLGEGWYLMNTSDLERELRRWRTGDGAPSDNVQPLTIAEALSYRNAGNLEDELGRSLRLVLRINSPEDLHALEAKRLAYEPDYLGAPGWRRAGSKPVNVVPLRPPEVRGRAEAWWDEATMAAMEAEWSATGAVDGLVIPGEYRSFVFKTIAALRAAEQEVNVSSIVGSLQRWLSLDQAEEIRRALDGAQTT